MTQGELDERAKLVAELAVAWNASLDLLLCVPGAGMCAEVVAIARERLGLFQPSIELHLEVRRIRVGVCSVARHPISLDSRADMSIGWVESG